MKDLKVIYFWGYYFGDYRSRTYLDAVGPVTGRVFHHTQRIDGICGVHLSVRHEQGGLLQPVTEGVHFRVDEQWEQVLYRYVVCLVLKAQRFCEALYVRL